jgi:hypothetical protein
MPITPLDYESRDPQRKTSDTSTHVLAVLAFVLPLVFAGAGVIAPLIGMSLAICGLVQGRRSGQRVVFGFALYLNLMLAGFFVLCGR